MKKREIENRLRSAVADLTPNVYDRIASAQKNDLEQEGTIMEFRTTPNRKRAPVRRTLIRAIAACLVLTIAVGGLGIYRNTLADATILLDVNPSISMEINRLDRVLSVEGVNQDGVNVLDGMDLKRLDYNVAINAIIGAMLKNGYLTGETATVLVSVDSSDAEKAARIKIDVTDDIKSAVAASTAGGAQVFQQTLEAGSAGVQEIAAAYGISTGKAQLIHTLLGRNAALRAGELAPLSVQDILALAALNSVDLAGAVEYDDGDYAPLDTSKLITHEEAKAIALLHAGGGDVMECELDYERGMWQYEIEVIFDGYEYDIDIDAADGSVIRTEKERTNRRPGGTAAAPDGGTGSVPAGGGMDGAKISADEAAAFALAAAGKGEVVGCEWDDGKYEVKIRAGVDEYEYDVDHTTGEARLRDVDYGEYAGYADGAAGSGAKLSLADAKAAALKHAGSGKVVSSELDDGMYEIEIRIGDDKYEYKVDPATGAVRLSDVDYGEYGAGSSDYGAGDSDYDDDDDD